MLFGFQVVMFAVTFPLASCTVCIRIQMSNVWLHSKENSYTLENDELHDVLLVFCIVFVQNKNDKGNTGKTFSMVAIKPWLP